MTSNESPIIPSGAKVIDLFAGAGGLSLGFREAGYEITLAIDNDEAAVEHYRRNVGKHIESRNIKELDPEDLPDVDGIIGGPPCQGFSLAGHRDPDDDRSSLVYDFIDIVGAKQPKFFVMENVSGLQSMQKRKGLVEYFEEEGYDATSVLLQASNFGVPQSRERLFFIGVRKDLERDVERFEEIVKEFQENPVPVKDALPDFDYDYFYRHPHHYGRKGVFSADQPYPTVRRGLRPMPSSYDFHENDESTNRDEIAELDMGQLALIQTFPEEYDWDGTKRDKLRLIANAVPPKLGEKVARAVQNLPKKQTLKDFA